MASRPLSRLSSRPLALLSKPAFRRHYALPPSEKPASLEPEGSSINNRDPQLPPRPPLDTYPHPFVERRDDPRSNSMRMNYLHATTARSRTGPLHLQSNPQAYDPEKWSSLNEVLAHSTLTPSALENTIITPTYVIHVKSSSNNTIISLHAPGSPKQQVTSTSAAKKDKGGIPFSVEANPDAPEVETDSAETANPSGGQKEPSSTTVGEKLSADEAVKNSKALAASINALIPQSADKCFGWASGGSCHYRKVNRSTFEAGYAASVRIIRRIEEAFTHLASGKRIEDLPPMKEVKAGSGTALEPLTNPLHSARGIMRLKIIYSGFGVGREAFNAAMLSGEGGFVRGLVTVIQDRTPVKVGGCRGKKTRRV